MLVIVVAVLFGLSVVQCQRPSDASTCDYYAETRYGKADNDTELDLVQSIVSLAFAGNGGISGIPPEITGILNPGYIDGLPVNLRPRFDGSLPTTNLHDQPVGINWLDDGDVDPLYAYLNGSTQSVNFDDSTNQYRLFAHFFTAFSHIFGCSYPPPPGPRSSGGSLSLAYVHKYMNLNFTDIGHFIEQLTLSANHFGFSDQDTQTLKTKLNSQYNVRCAPAVSTNPNRPPQLLSLCQAPSCPLAAPEPDCDAYVNLTAEGTDGSAVSSSSSSAPSPTSTQQAPTTIVTISPPTTPAATTSAASSSGGSTLSAGGIAGTVIGAVAVLLIGVGILLYCLRRRKPQPDPREGLYLPNPTGYASPTSATNAHTSYATSNNPYQPSQQASHHAILAEMESPRAPERREMSYMSFDQGEHPQPPPAPHNMGGGYGPNPEGGGSPRRLSQPPEIGYIQSVERGGRPISHA